ncbi:MAG: ubiquinol-cytochrome C chaperone family protein [Geminicoccaceae bacterium]
MIQGGWLSGWFRGRGERARLRETAAELYRGVVREARRPCLYARFGVPDTADGRLEMIMLFAALVMRRLKREGHEGEALAQELFDLMFADIDRNFREQGVSDISVGKHVKRAASTFMARTVHVEQALAANEPEALAGTIRRNLRVEQGMDEVAASLVAYDRLLADWPHQRLIEGAVPEQGQRD